MNSLVVISVVAITFVIIFDYTNGFHDASNIVATVIASRAMTPVQAVVIVATFEFLGPILGGTAVANTIGKFVNLEGVDPVKAVTVIFCGIIGAINWMRMPDASLDAAVVCASALPAATAESAGLSTLTNS